MSVRVSVINIVLYGFHSSCFTSRNSR